MAPDRALPLEFEVVEPVRRLDHRRSVAGGGVCNSHLVGCSAEPDVLLLLGRLARLFNAFLGMQLFGLLLRRLEPGARFGVESAGRGLRNGAKLALQYFA